MRSETTGTTRSADERLRTRRLSVLTVVANMGLVVHGPRQAPMADAVLDALPEGRLAVEAALSVDCGTAPVGRVQATARALVDELGTTA